MTARKFVLAHKEARQNAARYCMEAPDGYEVRFTEPKKSRDQEALYHCLIQEIANTVPFMGEKQDLETWKRVLVEAFVHVIREECQATGKPDPFRDQSRLVPSLDGLRLVQLGVQTRRFTVALAAQFIEYLYAYGSENGVRFKG